MINFDFEDNREDYFDIVLIPVEKKSHIVDNNAKRIRANKFLLSSASRFFKSLFTFGKEKFENEIQFEVLDVNMSVMIINAIYKGNLMELLSQLQSVDEKILMVSMCSRFELKINYDDMLKKIEVDSSSIAAFVSLLHELGKSIQNYIGHIAKYITNIDELSEVDHNTYNYIKSYIHLNFVVSYSTDYFCICNVHNDSELVPITSETAIVVGFHDDTLLLQDHNKVISFNIKNHHRNIELNFEENRIFMSDDTKLLGLVSSETITIHELGRENNKVITIGNLCEDVFSCIFTRDNSKIIVSDRHDSIFIWDIETTSLLNKFNIFDFKVGRSRIKHIISIPNSDEIIILLHSERNFSVWNTKTSQKVYDSEMSFGQIYSICISPDNKRVATNQINGTIIIWENGHIIQVLDGTEKWDLPGPIAYSPFGDKLISTCESTGCISIRNAIDGSLIRKIDINSPIDSLFYSQ